MSKYTVNKRDYDRVLLTDVLPYETPIIFSNLGIYELKKKLGGIEYTEDKSQVIAVLINNLYPKNIFTIPYSYRIKASNNKRRLMGVMHPKSQLDAISLYREFEDQIIHLCSKSKHSLRYPHSVGKYFYEKEFANDEGEIKEWLVEEDRSVYESQPTVSSSYFAYKRYNLLYKFYSSREYLNLETKFSKLRVFDINKCFGSIYTHTISWAVKSKKFSKKNIGQYSFEKVFDDYMMRSNYNETNGILVGSEISRIFAEIILQRVDQQAVQLIEEKTPLKSEKDFVVRRYVDDYFIFTNDTDHADEIYKQFEIVLENYKLHTNESKTKDFQIPFMTPLSSVKEEVAEYLTLELADIQIEKLAEFQGSPFRRSQKVINKIKRIISSFSIGYEGVTTLILSIYRDTLLKLGNGDIDDETQLQYKKVLIYCLDVMFFVYAMDTKVRSTYIIAQTIISINSSLNSLSHSVSSEIRKFIIDKTILLLNSSRNRGIGFSAEIQNLLIALSCLGEKYAISPRLIRELISASKQSQNELGYFELISLLFYIRDHKKYESIRLELQDEIINTLNLDSEDLSLHADLVMLAFDAINCPYIDESAKKVIAKLLIQSAGASSNTISLNKVISEVSAHKWFTDWKSTPYLGYLLYKKELKTPYG